jgi:hypothetical protein
MYLNICTNYPYLMSTFSLEQIIINTKHIFRRIKIISLHYSNPFDPLESFTLGTQIIYK